MGEQSLVRVSGVSMKSLRDLIHTLMYGVCLSLIACGGSPNEAVQKESLLEAQVSAHTVSAELAVAHQSPGDGESSVDVSNGQKDVTTKVFEKTSDVVTNQTNDDHWPERKAIHDANRVEKVCATLYAYDPNDTGVNLRDRPNGAVIKQVANLSEVYRADDAYAWIDPGTWNHIELFDGTRGYLWGDLLRHTAYRVYDPNDTSANFRSSPGGDVITPLANETEVEFLGESDGWTHVLTGRGADGYVATSLLATPNCF